VLSPLDRFRLDEGAFCGLLSGSVDSLVDERVERRGGMCMLYGGKHGIESEGRRVVSRVCDKYSNVSPWTTQSYCGNEQRGRGKVT